MFYISHKSHGICVSDDEALAHREYGRDTTERQVSRLFTGPDDLPLEVVKVPFGDPDNAGGHALSIPTAVHRAFDLTTCREIVIVQVSEQCFRPYDLIRQRDGRIGVEAHHSWFYSSDAIAYADAVVQQSL